MIYINAMRLGLILAFFLSSVVLGSEPETGQIKGQINFCNSGGVEGMRVYVPGRNYVVYTAADGRFFFDTLPAGAHELVYALDNKILMRQSVSVPASQLGDLGDVAFCYPGAPATTQSSNRQSSVPVADKVPPPEAVSCKKGYADCDGDPSNGCETDIMVDDFNCGACNNFCGGEVCVKGSCRADA